MKYLQFSVCCLLINLVFGDKNNVCKNLHDFRNARDNSNCWYNPDVGSSLEQIVPRYGYQVEKHLVKTEDGYTLILYRILNRQNQDKLKQPVLLQYGIGGAAEFWLLRAENSTAFMLSDNGYDVWITNFRGANAESPNEARSRKDADYWNFSFHEMGTYDLPAMVDYVYKVTKGKLKLIYVGHSMGTTMSYIYASEKKQHAEQHLKGIISMAPVMYMRSSSFAYQTAGRFYPLIYEVVKILGIPVIVDSAFIRQLIYRLCSTYPSILLCHEVLAIGNGRATSEERPDLIPVFMSYFPTSTAIKTILHFIQIIHSKNFQKYDYGRKRNNIIYNSPTPPEYDTDRITLPIHFFMGTNDAIATLPDVEIIYQKLKQRGVTTTKHIYDYAHNDFFIGKYYQTFHDDLLNTINDLSKNKERIN